jgi:hypothetical protein
MLSAWQPGRPISDGVRTVVETIMIMLSATDPPRLHAGALPLFAAALIALAALFRVKPFHRLPFALSAFSLSSLAGALVAHVGSYTGRFSIHLIGAMTAVLVCAVSQLWTAALSAVRPRSEPAAA